MRTATTTFLVTLALATMSLPATGGPEHASEFVVVERTYGARGELHEERGYMSDDHDLRFVRSWTHKPQHDPPGQGGGGGNGDDDGGTDPGTDCESDRYAVIGYAWSEPFSAYTTAHEAAFGASLATWDAETTASIDGGVTLGHNGGAGEQDFVNQFDFVDLGSSGTIAVTTTWYFSSTGEAVESDAQYNSHYDWATDGSANAMDVQAIGTHEVGHTFGLDHPNGPPHRISCLTMYAYGSEGDTHQRTLGDGDILGIGAIYGA